MRISSMENNPLRQYFRRPAVHLKLPSGGMGYSENVLTIPESGEIPIFPITAIDEITARTPDALFNGTAVTELIMSCVPCIKDPWSITSDDLDAILIGIRAASSNGTMDIDTECPACKEISTYGVSLVGILSTLKAGDYNKEYATGDLTVRFKPLIYKEMNEASLAQFEVQKTYAQLESMEDNTEREEAGKIALKKITDLTMRILSQAIEYIATPGTKVEEKEFILDFLKNCDKNVYYGIRDFNASLKENTSIKPLNITCNACQHKYEQEFTLNQTDFFG